MILNRTNSKKRKAYYCPHSGCMYNNNSEKYFSEKRFLNQHIAKVHAEKKFLCGKCGKGFGLDWLRKDHEKTCGTNWLCDCGSKYTSREGLLTHARRSAHDLPDIFLTDRMKQRKALLQGKNSSVAVPMIFFMQPIIQGIQSPVLILPKVSQSDTAVHPSATDATNNLQTNIISKTSSIFENTKNINALPNVFNDADNNKTVIPHLNNLNSNPIAVLINKAVATQTPPDLKTIPDLHLKEENLKRMLLSTATQTSNDLQHNRKTRQSRASQCSRRKSKASVVVGNESTHTQTAESAMVTIKRKRSRRKSVAITTDNNMLTPQRQELEDSVWPNFNDLIYQNTNVSAAESFRNTMSTQTNYTNKILCDSQTITDEELFDWDMPVKKDFESNICQSFGMPDVSQVDPPTVLQNNSSCNNLSDFNLFSLNSALKIDKHTGMSSDFTGASSGSNLGNETCPLFDMFNECSKSVTCNEMPHPVLSDIHTQTMANSDFDFNLLANMETQTTDELPLYDLLEFSDTETQTPWNDFADINESALVPDQLSIEIQTDFSSLNTPLNSDPYAFFNGTYVQSMLDDCAYKEKFSVNIETQTQDRFVFPELTNSECQTPELNKFAFSQSTCEKNNQHMLNS